MSTANITGMFCCWRRFCQRSGGCQATSSSSSRTDEQRTPLRCCDVKHQASLDRNSGQQTHQTSIQLTTLQNLESNKGTRLPDSNTEYRRVEVAPHRCVGRVKAECH